MSLLWATTSTTTNELKELMEFNNNFQFPIKLTVSHIHNPANFPHFTQASTPPTINSPDGTPHHPTLPFPKPVHVSSSSQSKAH